MSEPHGGLVVTYHAIEPGDSPLCIEPSLFEEHVEALAAASAAVLTVSELARAARDGTLPENAVAITFDDAFASVARAAAPILERLGYPATVFAVVGHLGGANDWPTQPAQRRRGGHSSTPRSSAPLPVRAGRSGRTASRTARSARQTPRGSKASCGTRGRGSRR